MNDFEISFFLPMIPPTVTAQEHRAVATRKGKVVFYDTPELLNARGRFMQSLAGFAPAEKLSGAIKLKILWCFPLSGKHQHGDYKITKPDTDNLLKLFKDCMTKVGFWNDDAQVAWELSEKRYSTMPGIFVAVGRILKDGVVRED